MADAARTTPTAELHPIPRSPYAHGEVPPVVEIATLSGSANIQGMTLITGMGSTFRQLVQCWARHEKLLDPMMLLASGLEGGTAEYAAAQRAVHWKSREAASLRQFIIGRPATTFEELLLKTVVYADCCSDNIEETVREAEVDLYEANRASGVCDVVVRESIMLDLLRLLKESGLTLDSLCVEEQTSVRAA